MDHRINTDPDHPTAKVGETTYRVRWYGYSPKDDTYEPTRTLPHNKLLSYYKLKKLAVPAELDKAIMG